MPEQVFLAQPISTAAGRVIASPFQFVTTGEDNLQIGCHNSLTGVTLAIQGRRLSAKGTVEAFAHVFIPSSDRLMTSTLFPLGVGAILTLTIFAAAGMPQIGQTFVHARLVRGYSGGIVVLGTILQGYVTSHQQLAWPGSPIESSQAGGGVVRHVIGTDPAAGANVSEAVPAGARWTLLAFQARFQTDATVANRRLVLEFISPAVFIFGSAQPNVQTAGQDVFNYWAGGMPLASVIASDALVAGLPIDLVLLPQQEIRCRAIGGVAGDDFLAPVLTVREWLEVA